MVIFKQGDFPDIAQVQTIDQFRGVCLPKDIQVTTMGQDPAMFNQRHGVCEVEDFVHGMADV